MSERDGYVHGVPCWVATLQPDREAAAAFYAELLGWDVVRRDSYLVGQLRGRDVAAVAPLPPGFDPPPAPAWVTHVWVDDADGAARAATAAGAALLAGPLDAPSGRLAVIRDPGGAVLALLRPRGAGAQVVNEPGAWSMSRLDTHDAPGAEAFYAQLFGWTTETFGLGEGEITMFRLPGYVGGEPSQPVSREVVATMGSAPPGAPAQWSVDFWVPDVAAAVAKAQRLGGAALAGPFDIGIGTSAVLADPWGASFSVTHVDGTGTP